MSARRSRRNPSPERPPTSDAEATGPGLHQSVLYEEVLQALAPHAGGYVAVDGTTGGGGHSYGLLERSSPDGRLIGLDADVGALERAAERLAPFEGRFRLVNVNFRHLAEVVHEVGVDLVDAVVLDLGLSSTQLDVSGRGFSFRFDEPLDMRMDPHTGDRTAAELLNEEREEELARIFREYGEEPRARRVARVVAEQRLRAPLERTGDFVRAITRALGPARGRIHPATRVFQAVRIAVNDELGALEEGLPGAVKVLKPGGRIAVISFHSLEDRIVKWRFREWADERDGRAPLVQVLTRKPIVPSEQEQASNPRSRSAKLRVAERLPTLSPA